MLLALVVWCGYLFLHARMNAMLAAALAGAFVMASIVPVYFVWITPELFNFSLGLLAYFCWLQGGGGGARAARHALAVRRGDDLAAAAPRHRDVLEGHERAAVPADPGVAGVAPAMGGSVRRRSGTSSGLRRRPVPREHGDLRRVELPGGISPHLRLGVSVSEPASTFEVGPLMGRDESLATSSSTARVLDEPGA